MFFTVICKDKPGELELRLKTRPSHLEFLDRLNSQGILKMAGPFLDADGKPCGTLAILEAGSVEEAEKLAAEDPYAKVALFQSIEISSFNWVVNKPA